MAATKLDDRCLCVCKYVGVHRTIGASTPEKLTVEWTGVVDDTWHINIVL